MDDREKKVFEVKYAEVLKGTEYDFPKLCGYEWEFEGFDYDFGRWLIENTEWNGQDDILFVE